MIGVRYPVLEMQLNVKPEETQRVFDRAIKIVSDIKHCYKKDHSFTDVFKYDDNMICVSITGFAYSVSAAAHCVNWHQ